MNTYSLSLLARLRQWMLREPLVHFIALGALIFVGYEVLAPQAASSDKRIDVSMADLERLRDISLKQWGKEPDTQTMQDMVQSFVREEVLYREALASGLDRDDVIVRRRMAQKMEFLAHESVREPSEAELRNYFESHPQSFSQAAKLDLEQVIFDSARRGAATETVLQDALAHLRAGGTVHGDSMMLPLKLMQQDQQQLQRDFGNDFAKTLYSLPDDTWVGPVRSAMGLHLVRVHHHEAKVTRFENVRSQVLAEMTNARVEQARNDAYARLLARYTVTTPTLDEVGSEKGTTQVSGL